MTQALRVALWVPTVDPPEVGDGILTTNPTDTHKAITTKFQLGGGSGGGGIGDAPSDGKPYMRQNAAWVTADVIDGGVF